MLASLHISVPAREEAGISDPPAPPDLVRGAQGLCHLSPMLRQQIGMSFGDVTLPLLRQLDLSLQVEARKPAHQASSCSMRPSPRLLITRRSGAARFWQSLEAAGSAAPSNA